MSSRPLMLEGEVDTTASFVATVTKLQARIDELQEDLEAAKLERDQAKKEAARAVAGLRKTLNPLYHSLKVLYGEMEGIGGEESAEAPKSNARWESLKQRMPGRPAEMIDLLLVHGSMSVKNLMATMHCGKDAVYQAASKLGQAGAVVNNGGRYSLKQS